MQITKLIWELWKSKTKANQYYINKYIEKIEGLGIKPPEKFFDQKETKILITLNGDFTNRGKSLTEIRYDTGISYPVVIEKLKKLTGRECIIRKDLKKKNKIISRLYFITQDGLDALDEWKVIHNTTKLF